MKPGQFITFEGGEGAGKTTQAKMLVEALEGAGIETLMTREPGGTFGAEAIRDLVLEGTSDRWSGMTELLAYVCRAARPRRKTYQASFRARRLGHL